MALVENVAYYLIIEQQSDEVVGYAAYGTADFATGRRISVRGKRSYSPKLMSNVFIITEGQSPGFSICDSEEEELYRRGLFRYRDVTYALRPAPEAMHTTLWEHYLGESFD